MRPSPGNLAAHKAVLLGHGAAASQLRRRTALQMVCVAIDKLGRARRRDRLFQLAFYHLVRAEILRFGGDPVPDRQTASAISKRIRSDLFKCYMELERETEQLLKKTAPYQLQANATDQAYSPWHATVSE
jgi:hypothetical protein